jgi:hypothetical protein
MKRGECYSVGQAFILQGMVKRHLDEERRNNFSCRSVGMAICGTCCIFRRQLPIAPGQRVEETEDVNIMGIGTHDRVASRRELR